MDDRLREIEERVAKATEGPWEVVVEATAEESNSGKDICMLAGPAWIDEGGDYDYTVREDLEFMAHAREDIPYLLNALREAREATSEFFASEEALRQHRLSCKTCYDMVNFCEEGSAITLRHMKARRALEPRHD